jgi:hypothetical protein
MPANNPSYPNGTTVAYYGTAASCQKFALDTADYNFAITRPDAALWSLSAQSAIVFDKTVPAVSLYSLPPVSTWAPSTVYAKGQAVCAPPGNQLGNKIYQCLVGGTSASSGNGPTGGGIVADGSVTWNYVGGNYGG